MTVICHIRFWHHPRIFCSFLLRGAKRKKRHIRRLKLIQIIEYTFRGIFKKQFKFRGISPESLAKFQHFVDTMATKWIPETPVEILLMKTSSSRLRAGFEPASSMLFRSPDVCVLSESSLWLLREQDTAGGARRCIDDFLYSVCLTVFLCIWPKARTLRIFN